LSAAVNDNRPTSLPDLERGKKPRQRIEGDIDAEQVKPAIRIAILS
jgi:hypothetical protein